MIVNYILPNILISLGHNKMFDYVLLDFFFTVLWHFIDQMIYQLIEKLTDKNLEKTDTR